ncbi:uncharacterized protein TrAtP1_007959 [Trichoderma atroviride]|uniref:uncharacterized protein n=1 Tax=Hypocrea atroviridis TaxID=63577 RepID=UPI00332C6614|nr:hypothetical protein TrAtP1_007959 [Trichoderma atroviride]
MAAPGTCHRADSLAALLCGPTALAPQRAKDVNSTPLGGILWGAEAPPLLKAPAPDAPDVGPRQTAHCTELPWAGALPRPGAALLLRAKHQLHQRAAHCAPKLAPAPFSVPLHYYAGQTAAWANQRSRIPSPFSSPSQRLQSLHRGPFASVWFLFFFFLSGVPSVPKIPPAATKPCC